jgi:aspartyl-tRNA(Asn)/glutamyl-tRNA(Gln) amidotransferase subunit B
VDEIAAAMPVLPDALRARFTSQYGLSAYDAGVLTASRALADYFEAAVRAGAPPKLAANWIASELLRELNNANVEISSSPISPGSLAALLAEVESGRITTANGKIVFAKMYESGKSAAEIIALEGFQTLNDSGEIERICREVIEKSTDNAAKYRSGNEGVFKFFVGQVMRATRGQANPQVVNDTLRRLLVG